MPAATDRAASPALFDKLYADPEGVPWDIGKPQDELVWAVWNGEVRGPRVLDVGCGTGDNSVLLAMHGFEVVGFDLHPSAIAIAQERAKAAGDLRGSLHLLQADIFKLEEIPELGKAQFDTALDSAVFHCIGNDEVQAKYVAALAQLVKPGGRLLLHALSDRNPDPWEGPPRRISENHARRFFTDTAGWRVESVKHCKYETNLGLPGGVGEAIFLVACRL
eukprot:TRINITY_DN6754_c0_g1_i1.p1 TRINITY_DN6754_c0_g1~~TRINITY_DN6754_c0_g1_i1.p1  ORF type:complete len:220 (+),score=44.20 TRINITY_DN6754_c0_g1_i1:60-719(+)